MPGPGTCIYYWYLDEALYGINQKGKYYSAKHKNSPVRGFNDSVARGTTFHNVVPGPGKYETGRT